MCSFSAPPSASPSSSSWAALSRPPLLPPSLLIGPLQASLPFPLGGAIYFANLRCSPPPQAKKEGVEHGMGRTRRSWTRGRGSPSFLPRCTACLSAGLPSHSLPFCATAAVGVVGAVNASLNRQRAKRAGMVGKSKAQFQFYFNTWVYI